MKFFRNVGNYFVEACERFFEGSEMRLLVVCVVRAGVILRSISLFLVALEKEARQSEILEKTKFSAALNHSRVRSRGKNRLCFKD
jgi:hypothetical protein